MTLTPAQLLDAFLFLIVPYVATTLFVIGTIVRYRRMPFTVSSLSSQFLENRQQFWAVLPFHIGILSVLTGHLIAFLLPDVILGWNSAPLRLFILEGAALVLGLLTLISVIGMIIRRRSVPRLKPVGTPADIVVSLVLLVQVFSGVYTAVFHGWGSSWFASTAAPYLWSLLLFQPDSVAIAAMPVMVKIHITGAFVLLGLTPFTRLMHALVMPLHYLLRRPQVVRWYGIRRLTARGAAGIASTLREGR